MDGFTAQLGSNADCVPVRTREKRYSLTECEREVNELLETDPWDFGRKDLATLNLLCAPNLPGSETLDVSKCLARLDRLTAYVKTRTESNLHRFSRDPTYGHSEPMWRMAMLVTNVKRDFGAAYSPTARDDLLAGINAPFSDSREVFIHGLLDDDPKRRWGTCTSIPSLIAAVARRLHYPVGLAVTRNHVYAKWEGSTACFNIEASNPMGMTVESDDHYRDFRGGLDSTEEKSGYYLRTLYPAEEFAMFLKTRVVCLRDAARYDETLLWSARGLQYAPDDPHFAEQAHFLLDLTMRHRLWRRHPDVKIPSAEDPRPFTLQMGGLLAPEERSNCLTIIAHYREMHGELDTARAAYEDSCRQNFHGANEQRDLQRFLKKHGFKKRDGPLLPPKNLGFPRRVTLLSCNEQEEAELLRRLVDQLERTGELLKARDTLHDLYMFDPCDAGVFQRARAIEMRPLFQEQLNAVIEERRRLLRETGVLRS